MIKKRNKRNNKNFETDKNDLISKKALKDSLGIVEILPRENRMHEFKHLINLQPTINIKPIIHARWLDFSDKESIDKNDCKEYYCSSCMHLRSGVNLRKPLFCENCGAIMDKEKSN